MPTLTYALLLQPPPLTTREPTEAQIVACFEAHAPPGATLEAMRPHVTEALRRQLAVEVPDPLSAEAAALELHLLSTQDDDLRLLDDRLHPRHLAQARFLEASEGLALTGALLSRIRADPRGPKRRRLFAPDDVRSELIHQLQGLDELLARAQRQRRRFRLVHRPLRPSADDQLAVLASAGITPRPGTPREQLFRGWPPEAWPERPWGCLTELIEHSDALNSVCLKRVEGPEDRHAYAQIAEQVRALAHPRLPLQAVRSEVDLQARTAWITFRLDGRPHRWELAWRGEWIDEGFLGRLDRLLRRRVPGCALFALDVDRSESLILLCLDRPQALRLGAAGVPLARMQ